MTTKRKAVRSHEYFTTALMPDGSTLYVIRTNRSYLDLAGGFLTAESAKYPDPTSLSDSMLHKTLTWNKQVQETLAQVGMELAMSTLLEFDVTIEAGTEYNLEFSIVDGKIAVVFTYPTSDTEPCFDMRTDSGYIQWSNDCGESWHNVVSLESIRGERGETGVQGEQGIAGQDGIDGHDGRDGIDGQDGADGADGRDGVDGRDGTDSIQTPPEIEDGDELDNICGAAERIRDYLLELYQQMNDNADSLQSSTGTVGVGALVGLVVAATGVGAVAAVALGAVAGIAGLFASAFVDGQTPDIDLDGQARMHEIIYCALKSLGQPLVSITDTAIAAMKDGFNADTAMDGRSAEQLANLYDMYTVDSWQRIAYLGSLTPNGVCAGFTDCPEDEEDHNPMVWHIVETGETSNASVGVGELIAGNRWRAEHIGDQYYIALVTNDFNPADYTGKKVVVYATFTGYGDYPPVNWGIGSLNSYYLWTDTHWYGTNANTRDTTGHGMGVEYVAHTFAANSDPAQIRLSLSFGSYDKFDIRVEIEDA